MIRSAFRYSLIALGLILLLLIGVLVFLQTAKGKEILAAKLSDGLSTSESGIEIAGIDGWLPLDMRLKELRLSDRDGVWLEAEDVILDWSPSALIEGRLNVDQIGARRLVIKRLPEVDETSEPDDQPFRLPELPASVPPLTIQRLAIPEIALGPAVLGEAATFDLAGFIEAKNDNQTVTAKLDLQRTDETTASAALEVTLDLAGEALDLMLDVEETGGVIGSLAGRPEAGPASIKLNGNGPLKDWSGKLLAGADGLGEFMFDIGLALVEEPRMTVSGMVNPSPSLLPDDVAPLVGETALIDLDIIQTRAQALIIQVADLKTAFAALTVEGSIDFERGDLKLNAELDAPDLRPLAPLAKADIAGRAQAMLAADGSLLAPEGKLDLQASGFSFEGKTTKDIKNSIIWMTREPLDSEDAALDVTLSGAANGITIPDAALPDDAIDWKAVLAVPLNGPVTIESADIQTAETLLSGKGVFDPSAVLGKIDLTLKTPSLARIAGVYGQQVDGKAEMTASIDIHAGAEAVDVDLNAFLNRLRNLPSGVGELLGEQMTLQATARLEDANATAILESLALDAERIKLNGKGDADLEEGAIDGAIDITLSDLSALASLVEGDLTGALDLALILGGSLEAPTVDLALDSRDLVISGEPITKLAVKASGQNLIEAPKGVVSIDLNALNMPASLSLDYILADDILDLDQLKLEAPETDIEGAVDVFLETRLVQGELKGGITDLRAFEPLIGQAIKGEVDLSAVLSTDTAKASGDPSQSAVVALRANGVEAAFGRLSAVTLDATIADAFASPDLNGKITATGVEQGENVVDALTLAVDGGLDRFELVLSMTGEALEPFDLNADAAVALVDGVAVDLSTFEGAFAGEPLRLAKPLAFRLEGDVISLNDLDLSLGEARLLGNMELGAKAASGNLSLRSLPLTWSEVVGGPELNGRIQADVDLGGLLNNPRIEAVVGASDVIGEGTGIEEAPIDITLDARLDDGRLAADLAANGLTEKPITANVSLPMGLALKPFSIETQETGSLDGKIDIELQLSRLADLLDLEGQDMAGLLDVDLEIGGTLGEPRIDGPIELKAGSYENDASGTDIQDLNLSAIASTERIDVTRLSGRTGKRGSINAEGWVQLDSDADFPLSIRLNLDQAKLVDRDDAEATLSGEIAMIGNLIDPSIEGELNVDGAEIQIPDGGGTNLPKLEVEEIGGQIVNPPKNDDANTEEARAFDPTLGIGVTLPQKVYVRGRGLESEWQGDLRVTGSASDPEIVGDLRIKKGHFDFLDKRFELEQGEISFSGGSPPNPVLALQAVSEEDDFRAIIRLAGAADDPQILLESEPILPDDEILARLLFNRDLSEIGPVEAGKLALAVNRLRGGGGFDAFGEIRSLLKIDTLDVVSDDEGDSRVRAGKYLSDDVYIEVERGTADDTGRARIEIEVLPNIALEAEASENADSGVGVKWKLDY